MRYLTVFCTLMRVNIRDTDICELQKKYETVIFFAVINATYAVAKRKPEKIRLAGIRTLTSAIPVQRSNQLAFFSQLHKLR